MVLFGAIGTAPAATNQAVTDKAASDAAKNKDSYVQKTDKEIQDWTSKIKSVEERSENSGAKARQDLDRHIKALNENLASARKKLDEIRGSSEKAWQSLQDGLERTLDEVKRHYQKVVPAAPASPSKK